MIVKTTIVRVDFSCLLKGLKAGVSVVVIQLMSDSFKKVFGDMPNAFQNTRAMLAKENSPWKNLLNQKSANTLINLLH